MSELGLPNGRYQFEAFGALRWLTDFNGGLAVSRRGDAPDENRTWELVNADDGTVTLLCVGTGRPLALGPKDLFYYVLGDEPEPWRLRSRSDGAYDLVRVENGMMLWISGLHLLDHTPVAQQGADSQHDILPTRWVVTAV